MAFRIQLKQGSSLQAQTYLGMEGELFLDTQAKILYAHDGITPGGHGVALSEAEVVRLFNDQFIHRFTPELRAKLESIQALATKNADDVFLLDRKNHQGTQSAETLTGLGSMAFVDTRNFPFTNLMPDSGRFAGPVNPLINVLSTPFTAGSWFTPYNGGSASLGGKFLTDNGSFGGSREPLNADTLDLIETMGRDDIGWGRFGVEFYILKLTMGNSPVNYPTPGTDEVIRWLASTTNMRAIYGQGVYMTFVCWMKAITGSAMFGSASELYYDGVEVPIRTPLPTGWHHVRRHSFVHAGYDNGAPQLYLTPGASVLIALPAFFNGYCDVGIHYSPIPGFNASIA